MRIKNWARFNAGEKYTAPRLFDSKSITGVPTLEWLGPKANNEFARMYSALHNLGFRTPIAKEILNLSIEEWVLSEIGPTRFRHRAEWAKAGQHYTPVELRASVQSAVRRVRGENEDENIVDVTHADPETGLATDIEGAFSTEEGLYPDYKDEEDVRTYTLPSEIVPVNWGGELAKTIISLHLGEANTILDQPAKWTNKRSPRKRASHPVTRDTPNFSTHEEIHTLCKAGKDAYTYHTLGRSIPGCPTCRDLAKYFKRPDITPEYITALMNYHTLTKTI